MEDWSEKTADSPIEIKWREITATLESSRSYIKSDTDLFHVQFHQSNVFFTYDIYESDFKISLKLCDFFLYIDENVN